LTSLFVAWGGPVIFHGVINDTIASYTKAPPY